MQTSSYLEKALFHDQTSANQEHFESKAEQLFAQPQEPSYLELHAQRPLGKFPQRTANSEHTFTVVQKWEADPSLHPESPTDSWYHEDVSSRTQIDRWRISNVDELKHYAAVRSNRCLFYLHSLHLTA